LGGGGDIKIVLKKGGKSKEQERTKKSKLEGK
jgi:hypothetical protein